MQQTPKTILNHKLFSVLKPWKYLISKLFGCMTLSVNTSCHGNDIWGKLVLSKSILEKYTWARMVLHWTNIFGFGHWLRIVNYFSKVNILLCSDRAIHRSLIVPINVCWLTNDNMWTPTISSNTRCILVGNMIFQHKCSRNIVCPTTSSCST